MERSHGSRERLKILLIARVVDIDVTGMDTSVLMSLEEKIATWPNLSDSAIVQQIVPACSVTYLEGGGPDPRCYRVNCDKFAVHIPGFRTEWDVRRGAEELYAAFVQNGLTSEMFARYVRLNKIQEHLTGGRLDAELRWRTASVALAN